VNAANQKSGLEAKIASLTNERNQLSTQVSQLQSRPDADQQKSIEEQKRMADLEDALRKELGDLIASGEAEVLNYNGILIVNINEMVLFDPDSPMLKSSFDKRLVDLADIIKKAPEKILRIEGHTADVSKSKWPSSWDLGAQRAVNVTRFLQDKAGFDSLHMVAVSCGRYRPIAPNNTEADKKKNRRVEMVLVDKQLYELQELQKVSMK
jgi:chemotaxis protein MotB